MAKEVSPGLGQMRIPDILETIADLSNDEVFTPPDLANKVLDMLPDSIWSDSSATFLDPATKTGIFLREITKRLIAGLEEEIPDLQERVNHILTKQVYGLGITELTSLMSRRTLYCSTTANGVNSVCTEFEDSEGNIRFPASKHTFNKHGKCEVCGAGEDLYYEEEGLDNYAYSFLHDNMEEVFGDVKFDVIIGNPPYQLSDGGGNGESAIPLYNKFVEKSLELNPKYISMIIPSRWMKGGKGLDSFREKMINNKSFVEIHDYQDASSIFKNVLIDGGINYFLLNTEYEGKAKYHYHRANGSVDISKRFIKEEGLETVVRDSSHLSIIQKVRNHKEFESFSKLVSVPGPFGFRSYVFKEPERYKGLKISNEQLPGYVLLYGADGSKGGKRISRYINSDAVSRSKESIDKYKLFFPRAMGTNDTVPPEILPGAPGTLCTETFLKIGDFKSEEEMRNCLSFVKTKFFRALLYFNRASLVMASKIFSLIPLQDFSKPWTDEELYKKYKLTKEEIAYIEDNIDAME